MKTSIAALTICLFASSACASRPAASSAEESTAAVNAEIARLALASDSTAIARKLRDACSDPATRMSCYESRLVPLATEGKVKLAMGALGQLAPLDPDVRTDGHVYAHAIGIAAGQSTHDVAGAFTQCSESFQSGCYHGVIQAWFARLDSIGRRDANTLCQPFRASDTLRWIRFQCVHGMGHGLTMLYKHDLRKGLQGCDLLDDLWDRQSCYGGAFMENIVNVTTPHHPAKALAHDKPAQAKPEAGHEGHHMATTDGKGSSEVPFKAVDASDMHYPCSKLSERYLRSCYEMQTSVMLYHTRGDMAAAAKSCGSAPVAMRTVCYASLGRDISSYSQQKHPEAIRMCSLAAERYQPWCYLGVVKNFIDLNARASDGIAFCRNVPRDSNKQLCYSAVGEQILILAPALADRQRLCSSAEPAYLEACHYGARVVSTPPPGLARVWKSVEE